MQCGENSTQTAHTFVPISHTPGGPRFAHINGPLGEHTQSAQGRVRVSDALNSGKVIRLMTIVDECTRESPAIEVDTSLGEFRVRRVLDRIALERRLLEGIVLDRTVLWQESSAVCKSASLARSPPPMCFHYSDQKRAGFAFLISRGGIPCSVRLRTTDSVTGRVGFRNLWPADRLCFINGGLGVAAV